MLNEISAAVIFLTRLIEKSENFSQEQLEDFKVNLSDLLMERFKNHWFPEKPCKGQGYRCIRVNGRDRRDETLERAAVACGFKYEDMKLPIELTLWVDPNEVCCRFGEHRGSYCILATFSDKENEPGLNIEQPKKTEVPSKGLKIQAAPLSANNQQSSPAKQKYNSSPRGNKNWHGGHGMRGGPPPPGLWYSLLAPHWLPLSPPPPMLRGPHGKWGPHAPRRHHHWPPHKALKV